MNILRQTSADGLVTSSRLLLLLTSADDGKTLTCRAENPEMTAADVLETSTNIRLLCENIICLLV